MRNTLALIDLGFNRRRREGEENADELNLESAFTGVLSTLFKMDDGTIQKVLKGEDGKKPTTAALLDFVTNADKTRIEKLGQTFQDGYKKAKGETLTAQEKAIKEQYGVQTDLQGLDLVEHIISSKVSDAVKSAGKKDLAPDDIKALPGYTQIETAFKKAMKEMEDTHAKELENLKTGVERQTTLSAFNDYAGSVLDGLNPVVSENPKIAANWRKQFLDSFANDEIQKNPDGVFVILKDGKALQDAHGHLVQADEYIKARAGDFFEFAANLGGANAGNETDKAPKGGQSGYPAGIMAPKNVAEYASLVNRTDLTMQQKAQIRDAWNKSRGIA